MSSKMKTNFKKFDPYDNSHTLLYRNKSLSIRYFPRFYYSKYSATCTCISWWEKISWNLIVLADGNNCSLVDMLLQSDTQFWVRVSLGSYSLMPQLSGESTNTNFIVFHLTWLGHEPMIYRAKPLYHQRSLPFLCCNPIILMCWNTKFGKVGQILH